MLRRPFCLENIGEQMASHQKGQGLLSLLQIAVVNINQSLNTGTVKEKLLESAYYIQKKQNKNRTPFASAVISAVTS